MFLASSCTEAARRRPLHRHSLITKTRHPRLSRIKASSTLCKLSASLQTRKHRPLLPLWQTNLSGWMLKRTTSQARPLGAQRRKKRTPIPPNGKSRRRATRRTVAPHASKAGHTRLFQRAAREIWQTSRSWSKRWKNCRCEAPLTTRSSFCRTRSRAGRLCGLEVRALSMSLKMEKWIALRRKNGALKLSLL